ncbi:cysteine desulfurase NifS [uncultured Fretibacterium sp.]|uniref:cysteine desulfurase NifS n=1 Tax=uncultured Fretibacterium sp. TaxID=1678694 RepID=UPI0026252F48|nr:cysteine desulfurase NifS [uncultured Fretibacterium sp.]
MQSAYLDYAATTPTDSEVLAAMMPYFTEVFGNPSSVYSFAAKSRKAIDTARGQVARALNAEPDEIFFTGSGTEADNWALKGTMERLRSKGDHLITTKIEHHAILHTAEYLEKVEGFHVTYLPVDSDGRVRMEDLEAAMTDKTVLVSVMFANNEVGTIQPIGEIGSLCRRRGVLFHTDAVQAAAQLDIDVKALNIDMLSLSAHKMYGPKGVGAFYLRRGLRLENFVHGGGQEKGLRASTENLAGIVGLGVAIERLKAHLPKEKARLCALRDRLIDGVLSKIPDTKLNGARGDERLPNNTNFSFIGIEGETLLLDLDSKGISASTGSACSSASLEPSHVLLALGLSHEMAHGSLRMTLGRGTTGEQVDYVLNVLPEIVARRRSMSPLWEDFLKRRGEK